MKDVDKFLDKFTNLERAEKLDLLMNTHYKYKEELFTICDYFKSIGKKVAFIGMNIQVDEKLKLDIEALAKFRPSAKENKLIVITFPTLEDLKERDEKSTKTIEIDNMTIETFPITSLPYQLLQKKDILDCFNLFENSDILQHIRKCLKYYLGYFSMKSESQEIIKEKDRIYFYYSIQSLILADMEKLISNC